MSPISEGSAATNSSAAASPASASSRARDTLEARLGGSAGAEPLATAVIAEDHPLFVEAMRFSLSRYGIELIGSTGRGDEVVPLTERLTPDLLLLDLGLPGRSGLECLPLVAERCPETKVIVISADDRPETVDDALRSGATCFIAKSVAADDLARAILLVSDNSPVVISRRPPNPAPEQEPEQTAVVVLEQVPEQTAVVVLEQVPEQTAVVVPASLEPRPELTKREHEILALVAEGQTNSQVARTLWVTEQTVKFHLSNIFRKLDVTNRTQAAAKARQLGLDELEAIA